MKSIHIITFLALLGLASVYANETSVSLQLDKPQWVISKYLTGTHFVYAYEADWIYKDKKIIEWMKRCKVGFIRYPGGTVTMYWHWDNLNGYAFPYHVKQLTGKASTPDPWSREYTPLPKRDPKDYMDVDEYMAFCKKVGAEAMLGINILSGGAHRTVEEGKAEARRLVNYCKTKGYHVPFWYMGNEGYAKGFSPNKYAATIDEYAAIVKEVYPNAKIIADWKYGPRKMQRFEQSLNIIKMSKFIDVMEYHEKWGNDWGLYSGVTREDWISQKPFLYNGQFSEFYSRFEDHSRKLGRDVKHGHNEWGLGGMQDNKGVYDFALLTADFFIELFRHPTYMAAGWNLNMGPKEARVFLAENGEIELMPPSLVYEMVAHAMGESLIPMQVKGNDAVYGFASGNMDTRLTQVYLMNKSESTVSVSLIPEGGEFEIRTVERLVTPGKLVADTPEDGTATITLEPMSFTRIAGVGKRHRSEEAISPLSR